MGLPGTGESGDWPGAVAIYGPGLLGGSLALAASAFGLVRVWGRRGEVLRRLQELEPAVFVSEDAAEVARGADLLVLATPVGVMAGLAEQILRSGAARPGAVLTDVGSVKRCVVAQLEPLSSAAGLEFLGSHPMAGSEATGLEAARADLFRGAACVITPTPRTTAGARRRLAAFWSRLGCRVFELGAEEHDRAVGRVSHLPHLAAAVLVRGALEGDDSVLRLAGQGWKDTTRVASGDPAMWAEILLENRDAVLAAARGTAEQLRAAVALLECGDGPALRAFLREAKVLRDGGRGAEMTEEEIIHG